MGGLPKSSLGDADHRCKLAWAIPAPCPVALHSAVSPAVTHLINSVTPLINTAEETPCVPRQRAEPVEQSRGREAVFPWERSLSKEGGRPDGRDAGMLIPS